MKTLSISLTNPCHERFESFTRTTKGGYCGSCRKEVIDFRSWSDERLIASFKNGGGGCGNFREDQLKVYALSPDRNRNWWAGAFLLLLMTIFNKPAHAQSEKKPTSTEQIVVDSACAQMRMLKDYSAQRSRVMLKKKKRSMGKMVILRMGGVIASHTVKTDSKEWATSIIDWLR